MTLHGGHGIPAIVMAPHKSGWLIMANAAMVVVLVVCAVVRVMLARPRFPPPDPQATRCGDADVLLRYQDCRSAGSRSACEAAGGRWARAGILDSQACICPTGQEHCPCRSAKDCLSNCLVPEYCCREPYSRPSWPRSGVADPSCSNEDAQGLCAAISPAWGCACELDPQGRVLNLCID
jgi:hypothetical protein